MELNCMNIFTPSEAKKNYKETLPDFVVLAWNNQIIKNLNLSGKAKATIKLKDIKQEIKEQNCKLNNESIDVEINQSWLNIETYLKDLGWNVVYEQPSYGDTQFDAYYKLSER